LVLWTVALEALLLVVLAVVLLVVVNRLQQRQINETLRLGATQLNAVIDVQGNEYRAEAGDIVALRREGVLAWILTADGIVVQTVGDAATLPVPTTLPDFDQFRDGVLADGMLARLLVAHLQENGQELGVLVLALPLRDAQRVGRLLLWSLALAIPIVLLLSAMGGFFLAGRALAPVSTITATAQQISAADLSQRLELDLPDDEIGQLAQTFNAMLARLDRAFQRERQLTADVSHELRTPLAMLKTQLSLARSRPRDAATLLTMMADMEGDVDRMTRLIEQMLTLASVEQAQSPTLVAMDLMPLLQRLQTQLRPVALGKEILLQDNLDPTVALPILGDSDQLHQLFTNLLDNAIKYTPAGGQVTFEAIHNADQIQVTVADSGIGIVAEHLPHLFSRFYRTDAARARTSGGFGLGLAISRAIVQMHGGEIHVESTIDRGTTFIINFPKA